MTDNSTNLNENSPQSLYSLKFCTDNREVQSGSAFVALKGERFDGHQFIPQAIKAGATVVIGDTQRIENAYNNQSIEKITKDNPEVQFIQSSNPLLSMQSIARKKFNFLAQRGVQTIAITGSFGKTTTTRLTAHLLKEHGKTHLPIKNYNNKIGLPLTILNADIDTKYLVIEMGISEPRELEALTAIAPAKIRVITNIHEMHSEFFTDFKHLRNEKLQITSNSENFETFIIHSDINLEKDWIEKLKRHKITLKTFNPEEEITQISTHQDNKNSPYTEFSCKDKTHKINGLRSKSWLSCAVIALEILTTLNLETRGDIETFQIPQGRGSTSDLTFKTADNQSINLSIIDDSYNAGLLSMLESINSLNQTQFAKKKIAIIGEMKEVRENIKLEQHAEVFKSLLNTCDTIYLVGEGVQQLFSEYTNTNIGNNGAIGTEYHHPESKKIIKIIFTKNADETSKTLLDNIQNHKEDYDNSTILMKASCSVNLQSCVNHLTKNATN